MAFLIFLITYCYSATTLAHFLTPLIGLMVRVLYVKGEIRITWGLTASTVIMFAFLLLGTSVTMTVTDKWGEPINWFIYQKMFLSMLFSLILIVNCWEEYLEELTGLPWVRALTYLGIRSFPVVAEQAREINYTVDLLHADRTFVKRFIDKVLVIFILYTKYIREITQVIYAKGGFPEFVRWRPVHRWKFLLADGVLILSLLAFMAVDNQKLVPPLFQSIGSYIVGVSTGLF